MSPLFLYPRPWKTFNYYPPRSPYVIHNEVVYPVASLMLTFLRGVYTGYTCDIELGWDNLLTLLCTKAAYTESLVKSSFPCDSACPRQKHLRICFLFLFVHALAINMADESQLSSEQVAEMRKKRTFRKFTFRGVDLDKLLDLSMEVSRTFSVHFAYGRRP